MPRRFFRRLNFDRHAVARQWYMRPFERILHEPRIWSTRRRSIVPGVGVGLFCAWIPVPGHSIIAALVALALRVNIPVAVLATLITNPVTMGPFYYAAYRVGAAILEMRTRANVDIPADSVTEMMGIWQPFLLGCFILGSATAAVGYFSLNLIWRLSVSGYVRARRRRAARETGDEPGERDERDRS